MIVTQPMATRPVPSRNTDGSGVPVFGARTPPRNESGDTGAGMSRPDAGRSLPATRAATVGSPTTERPDSVIGVSGSRRNAGSPAAIVGATRTGSPANSAGVPPAAAKAPRRPSGANAARSRKLPRASPTGQSQVASDAGIAEVVCAPTTAGAAAAAAHTTIIIACLIMRNSTSETRIVSLPPGMHRTCQASTSGATTLPQPDRIRDRRSRCRTTDFTT